MVAAKLKFLSSWLAQNLDADSSAPWNPGSHLKFRTFSVLLIRETE